MADPRSPSFAAMAGVLVAALIGIGLVVYAQIGPPRPDASGDAGVIAVYAQTPFGPVRLVAGEKRELSRPQDFAFQFTCEGTGPRVVRIELADQVLHEEKLGCPANMVSLGYVLKLDDTAPNEVEIATFVEAPHDRLRVHRFPVILGR